MCCLVVTAVYCPKCVCFCFSLAEVDLAVTALSHAKSVAILPVFSELRPTLELLISHLYWAEWMRRGIWNHSSVPLFFQFGIQPPNQSTVLPLK